MRDSDGGSATLETTILLELRRGLAFEEVDRRLGLASRAGDVGARVMSFYLVDLVDRLGFAALGYNRIEDYAEARFQMRPSTTRESLKVGRALEELPEIDRAFREERLSWSHVRELTRVATAETEGSRCLFRL